MLLMKNTFIVFLICLCLIACKASVRRSDIAEISFENFEERMDNNQSFITIIGRNDCINCVELEKLLKNTDIDIATEIVLLKYTSEEKEMFLKKVNQYFTNIEMIPYYAYIEKGEIAITDQGYSQEEDFLGFLNDVNMEDKKED